MPLIFDIETAADVSDAGYVAWKSASLTRAKKDLAKAAVGATDAITNKFPLSPLTGMIINAGFLAETTHPISLHPQAREININNAKMVSLQLNKRAEPLLLADIWKIITQSYDDGHQLVTYNGREFDLPFLYQRSWINHIERPQNSPSYKQLTNRYDFTNHLDLSDIISYKYGIFVSLSEIAYLIGATDSLEREGGRVGEWYASNQFDEIERHCIEDLVKTYLLYDEVIKWMN